MKSTYQNNGGTQIDGGFNIDYGQSGYFVPESTGLLLCLAASSAVVQNNSTIELNLFCSSRF